MDLPDKKKLNRETIEAACKKEGVEFRGKMLDDTVCDLAAAMGKRAEASDDKVGVVECDVCGGDSCDDLDVCPYCGAGGIDEPAPQVSEEAEREVVAKAGKKSKKKAKKTAAKKTVKKAAKKMIAKKSSKKVAKKKTVKKAAAEKTGAKKAGRKASVVATTIAGSVDAVMSAELSQHVKKVQELQSIGLNTTYEMGVELAHIYDNKLYLQMKGADDKPLYTDWGKFVREVFRISSPYSYRLMDVSLNFSKDQIDQVGVSKLSMLVRVPPKKRTELLKSAASTTRTKLAKEVAKLAAGKRRETGRKGHGDAGFRGTPGTGNAARKSDKLTVVKAKARVTVDLFAIGGSARADYETAQGAWGVEKCANGVEIHYKLSLNEGGDLELIVETKRPESEAAA